MELTLTFKSRLFEHCKNEIERRIANFQYAMLDAQESANSEDKSSAGDKYETGRAMSQIARDMNAKQLQAAKLELSNLLLINPAAAYIKAQKGALVQTSSNQIIFIATSIGVIDFDGFKIAVVSPEAPIAQALLNKGIGDEISIAQKKSTISIIL
jgi:transcription elongation GreA/GreB family factor